MPTQGWLIVRYFKSLNDSSVDTSVGGELEVIKFLLDLGKLKILSNLPKVTHFESSRTEPESWTLNLEWS